MRRTPVESSSLASAGYDARTSILEVEFHNGTVYRYFEVPKRVFNALMNAPSKGSFFNFRIKGVYRYKKV